MLPTIHQKRFRLFLWVKSKLINNNSNDAGSHKSGRVGRGVLICLIALLLLLFGSWLMVRQMASDSGKELRSADSQNGSCVLKTYTRRYSSVGLAGRIASLFGSSYYYRVYSRDGRLLATSEWTLWEREFGDMDAHWISRTAMYPGQDGWAGWRLAQCD